MVMLRSSRAAGGVLSRAPLRVKYFAVTAALIPLTNNRCGLGNLDYRRYLTLLDQHPDDLPLLLEHLPGEQYAPARDAIFEIGAEIGVAFNDD
jgi:hypothetical protein